MAQARKVPREFLLTELRRVAKLVGKIPTMQEFRTESRVSPETLALRFKGWKGALASAGFDPSKLRLTYDDLELIEELRRVAQLLRRTPTSVEFNGNSELGSSTLSQRFGGSWKEACRAAGLAPPVPTAPRPPKGWNKGLRKLATSEEELRYLYETEGLSMAAIASRLGVSATTVRRTMSELGIEAKKLHFSMPRETTIESLVYAELERRGVTFVKQQVVDGLWVVDALVPGARVVIECDGEYWHSRPEMVARDHRKDAYLTSRGYQVLRFPESAINADVRGCVQRVVDTLINRYQQK